MLWLESQRVFQNLLLPLSSNPFCYITDHLMTGPEGTVNFVSRESQSQTLRF